MQASAKKLVCALSLTLSFLTAALAAEPLPDPDNGVFSGIFHLPDSTEGASLLKHGQHSVLLNGITSNHSIEETFVDESLSLDGETSRLEIGYRFGIGSRLELGIDVPYVWHAAGALDGVIEEWHSIFGFPDGAARKSQPEDQLQFSYADPSGERLNIDRSSNGIGDIRLIAGWQLTDGHTSSTALRLGVTLPTGDSENLHGSGGMNISVGIAADDRELLGLERLNGYYRLQAIRIGEPDLLVDRYEEFVAQIAAGIGYELTDTFELRVQAAARSATYESNIEILGEPSIVLTFGTNIRVSEHYLFTLAVAEDIKVSSAPDVSFQLGLRYQP